MKRLSLIFLAASALVASASPLTVTVKNPLKADRRSVPVVVDLAKYAPGREVTTARATVKGVEIPVQIDDLDADGRADEIALLVDVPSKGKTVVSLDLDAAPKDSVVPLTHAYLKMRDEPKKHPNLVSIAYPGDVNTKQMYNSIYGHGSVIEGLWNAVRIYMDNRQSLDLYVKQTPRLELETTGFYTTQDQLAQGYGRDVLWAGKSVGAGSFRGYQKGEPATIDTVAIRGQRVVADGPVRSIIEVSDRGWVYNGKRRDMTQLYTLWGNHRDYQVDISISETFPGDVYATGIQKLETENVGFVRPDGLAGSWGSNVPEKKHPELVDTVGLGLYADAANRASVLEDDVNYLTILRPDADGHIRYWVNLCGTREDGGYETSEAWFSDLARWQKELQTPCLVEIK